MITVFLFNPLPPIAPVCVCSISPYSTLMCYIVRFERQLQCDVEFFSEFMLPAE